MKKGYVVVLDAMIALAFVLVIFTTIFGTHYSISKTGITSFKNLHYLSEDLLEVMNKRGILDQIGTGWVEANGNTTSEYWINASTISRTYLELLVPKNVGYRMTIDDETIIANLSRVPEDSITSETHSSRLLAGYGKGLPTTGYVARASLTNIREKKTSSYSYFGGFEGQGNLTKILTLPDKIDTVQKICMEYDSGDGFDMYIDGVNAKSFPASPGNMTASYDCVSNPQNYISNGGNKTFEVKFTGGNLTNQYIGGGFIRITYNTSVMDTTFDSGTDLYMFPGINGLINLYSSFYVPGTLNSMDMHLHYLSNYSTYLTIGNIKVFNSSFGNYTDKTVDLNNAYLSSILNYNSLSLKTIPIRMGILNLTYMTNVTGDADVILVTDVSGSMRWNLINDTIGIVRSCNDPNLYNPDTKRISLAMCLANELVDTMLNTPGNRLGLVSYSGTPSVIPMENLTIVQSYHNLSTNDISLKTQINGYSSNGATGLCGGIRQAKNILETQSNASRHKFIIVMTDGLANVQCDQTDEDNTTGCMPNVCPDTTFCAGGGCLYQQCNDYVSDRARDDAINASAEAHNDLNITVYSIGFGPVSNCTLSNLTLNSIAAYGNGSYYASNNATELQNIYGNIAIQIMNMSYKAQTVSLAGELARSVLYPDSYIKFSYTPIVSSFAYGDISTTYETQKFDNPVNCTGIVTIPHEVTVFDTKVTSYSSEHWTDLLKINGNTVYDLSTYGSNYRVLGDPFIVQIPANQILPGSNNTIYIRIGDTSINPTNCSKDDRAIITVKLKKFAAYGDVFPTALGCNWTIEFEDNTFVNINIPDTYNGPMNCLYSSTNISYDPQDAIDDAIYRLLKKLDYNNNNKLDVKFDSRMVEFNLGKAGGIRSLWGPVIVKLILWM